jgi:hypothetical protein
MSVAATLLHMCLHLRRNMSGDACHQCYFFQICVIGWVGSNCDCLYVKMVFLIFGASGSSWLHRKIEFLDVAIIIVYVHNWLTPNFNVLYVQVFKFISIFKFD